MAEERRPGRVPEEEAPHLDLRGPFDVTGGFDTDGDGHADTAVTDDGFDLILLTDLDGDGLADQILRIGPDGVAREVAPGPGDGRGGTGGLAYEP